MTTNGVVAVGAHGVGAHGGAPVQSRALGVRCVGAHGGAPLHGWICDDEIWIFAILVPTRRVGQNVVAYRFKIILVADDVFVVVALPHGRAWRAAMLVDALGDSGFEPCNE